MPDDPPATMPTAADAERIIDHLTWIPRHGCRVHVHTTTDWDTPGRPTVWEVEATRAGAVIADARHVDLAVALTKVRAGVTAWARTRGIPT